MVDVDVVDVVVVDVVVCKHGVASGKLPINNSLWLSAFPENESKIMFPLI